MKQCHEIFWNAFFKNPNSDEALNKAMSRWPSKPTHPVDWDLGNWMATLWNSRSQNLFSYPNPERKLKYTPAKCSDETRKRHSKKIIFEAKQLWLMTKYVLSQYFWPTLPKDACGTKYKSDIHFASKRIFCDCVHSGNCVPHDTCVPFRNLGCDSVIGSLVRRTRPLEQDQFLQHSTITLKCSSARWVSTFWTQPAAYPHYLELRWYV